MVIKFAFIPIIVVVKIFDNITILSTHLKIFYYPYLLGLIPKKISKKEAKRKSYSRKRKKYKVLAYVRRGQEYNCYYVIDLKKKIAKWGTKTTDRKSVV